jgi:hypothetical protein
MASGFGATAIVVADDSVAVGGLPIKARNLAYPEFPRPALNRLPKPIANVALAPGVAATSLRISAWSKRPSRNSAPTLRNAGLAQLVEQLICNQ